MSRQRDAERVRRRLAELCERRVAAATEDASIAQDITATIFRAKRAGVSISEVARLLDMDRTSLYRTYIGKSSERAA